MWECYPEKMRNCNGFMRRLTGERVKSRICLNMIVKNETPVLGRLFDSVKDFIDYYIIADTGSTDGTPEFIQEKMAECGISGEVLHHQWVNYGFNRNQAFQHVYVKQWQGWVLFIDADEEFACSDPLFYSKLQPGLSYRLQKHHGALRYSLPNLVDVSRTRWQWKGVVHEYLEHVSGPSTCQELHSAWIIYHAGQGVRSRGVSDAEKYLADAALLEKECRRNPHDARSRFYLAQSYANAGKSEEALRHYQLRAAMPGWEQENFVAQLRAARLCAQLNRPADDVIRAFLKAHELRPQRAEPLHDLAAYHRQQKQYVQAYQYAKKAAALPFSADTLFVEKDIYDWRILDEIGVSAYWTGHFHEARAACAAILERQERGELLLDAESVRRIEENLNFSLKKIEEQQFKVDSSKYAELLLGAGSRTCKDLLLAGMAAEFSNLIRLDQNKDHQPDVIWDLRCHPLPFADNSFDEIHAYQVLEHLAQQGNYEFFFAEFSEYWRILKPGGLFLASVPARDSVWAWGDPSHKRIIQPETLVFLDQDEYERQVGRTTMSDFRYLYKAHFKTVHTQVSEGTFYFALKKHLLF